MSTTMQDHIDLLTARGFDQTTKAGPYLKIRCSQCQVVCINGIPTHETGCPNAKHECRGCNELIPVRQKYCDNCR